MEHEIDLNEKKSFFFPLPYPLAVQGEVAAREKSDFWRFRVITNVLRQSPLGIEKYKERYQGASN